MLVVSFLSYEIRQQALDYSYATAEATTGSGKQSAKTPQTQIIYSATVVLKCLLLIPQLLEYTLEKNPTLARKQSTLQHTTKSVLLIHFSRNEERNTRGYLHEYY